jgi:hypothetical protein
MTRVITRERGTIPGIRQGSNEGMLSATLKRIAEGPTADQWCKAIHTWVRECEQDRLERTGARRLPGF